jgi:hypothetical protein
MLFEFLENVTHVREQKSGTPLTQGLDEGFCLLTERSPLSPLQAREIMPDTLGIVPVISD